MTLFPIVSRELRVAARRPGTYRTRFWFVLGGLVVSAWLVFGLFRIGTAAATQGQTLFMSLSVMAFVFCLFVGAQATGDCMSGEKRDGTLGLLFLTDLRGYDVVFGKLAANSLNCFYGLIALIPVLALPIQMGGVSGAQFAQTVLVLINTMFFSLSTGIFVSCLSFQDRKALYATFFTVALITAFPWVLMFFLGSRGFVGTTAFMPVLAVSPASGLVYAFVQGVPGVPLSLSQVLYVLCLVVPHVLAWVFLIVASRILPSVWKDKPENRVRAKFRERIQRFTYGGGVARISHRRLLLNVNPFAWLAGRERLKEKYVWYFLLALTGVWIWGRVVHGDVMLDAQILIATMLIVHGFLKLWVASEACTRIAEDRRIGALELLLSTPLGPREIIRGQFITLGRQFGKPMLVLVAIELVLVVGYANPIGPLNTGQTTFSYLASIVMLVFDALAIAWVAMWFGLRVASPNRAILRTVSLILLVPWGLFFITTVGWEVGRELLAPYGILYTIDLKFRGEPFFYWEIRWHQLSVTGRVWLWLLIGTIVNLAIGWWWARLRLLTRFREIAVEQTRSKTLKC